MNGGCPGICINNTFYSIHTDTSSFLLSFSQGFSQLFFGDPKLELGELLRTLTDMKMNVIKNNIFTVIVMNM